MKSRYNLLKRTLLAIILLLGGCASNFFNLKKEDAITRDEEVKSEEKKDNIKISQFILGTGDSLDISVYRHEDLKRSVRINNTGKIMFPLIGDVDVAGKGIYELRNRLTERLSEYIINPQVIINVTGIQSKKFSILGEVNSPGFFALDTDISLVEAISRAEGATNSANLKNVILIRREREKEKPTMVSINVKDIWKKADLSQNLLLQNGDVVYVPSGTIPSVARYFSYFSQILSTIISLESGIILYPQTRDVIETGDAATQGTTINIPVN